MEVIVINPHGFCAGINRALTLVRQARIEHPTETIYILGSLVHNEKVVKSLEKDGFKVLNEKERPLEDWMATLDKGDIVVFSAHGHNPHLDNEAKRIGLIVYDSTCPFVKANERLIRECVRTGGQVIYIGQKGHAEALGALGIDESGIFIYEPGESFAFENVTSASPLLVSQTTMGLNEIEESVSLLKRVFPAAKLAARVCDATEKRQTAIGSAPSDIDLYVVMGSATSNNTMKLYALAKEQYPSAEVIRILDVEELKQHDLSGYKKAALISGASTGLREFDIVKDYLLTV